MHHSELIFSSGFLTAETLSPVTESSEEFQWITTGLFPQSCIFRTNIKGVSVGQLVTCGVQRLVVSVLRDISGTFDDDPDRIAFALEEYSWESIYDVDQLDRYDFQYHKFPLINSFEIQFLKVELIKGYEDWAILQAPKFN